MFKRIRLNTNNDAIILLKYALLGLLLLLAPITLFLTAFSWYASLEFSKVPDVDIASLPLFLKNALIFGSIGLMSFLFYFLVFLVIDYSLKHADFKWKKFILLIAVIVATLFFLVFEILSGIFVGYFYTWQISLVLVFWPLIYILLFVLFLINYFELHNLQKNLKTNKVEILEKDEIDVIRDLSETIS